MCPGPSDVVSVVVAVVAAGGSQRLGGAHLLSQYDSQVALAVSVLLSSHNRLVRVDDDVRPLSRQPHTHTCTSLVLITW